MRNYIVNFIKQNMDNLKPLTMDFGDRLNDHL